MPTYFMMNRLVERDGKYVWVETDECDRRTLVMPDERIIRETQGIAWTDRHCLTCDNKFKDCMCRYRIEDYWGNQGLAIATALEHGESIVVQPWCVDINAPRTRLISEVAKFAELTDVSDDQRWSEYLSRFGSKPSLYRSGNGGIVRVWTCKDGKVMAEIYAKDEAAFRLKLRRISFGQIRVEAGT